MIFPSFKIDLDLDKLFEYINVFLLIICNKQIALHNMLENNFLVFVEESARKEWK